MLTHVNSNSHEIPNALIPEVYYTKIRAYVPLGQISTDECWTTLAKAITFEPKGLPVATVAIDVIVWTVTCYS